MRIGGEKEKVGDYSFLLEMDTACPPAERYTLWIYKNNQPLDDETGSQVRREFPENFNKVHMKNFMKKFASDSAYRKKHGAID